MTITFMSLFATASLADCWADHKKFQENYSAETKKAWANAPALPQPLTRENLAAYDIKKVAFKKERDLSLENFKKESQRRSDECLKSKKAENEARHLKDMEKYKEKNKEK